MNEGDLPFEGPVSFVSLYQLSCLKGGAIVVGKESSSAFRLTAESGSGLEQKQRLVVSRRIVPQSWMR